MLEPYRICKLLCFFLRFKEIREELARRNRRKQDENIVEEFYVDSDRMVAVQLSETFTDLKNIIQKSGMKFALSEMTGESFIK